MIADYSDDVLTPCDKAQAQDKPVPVADIESFDISRVRWSFGFDLSHCFGQGYVSLGQRSSTGDDGIPTNLERVHRRTALV